MNTENIFKLFTLEVLVMSLCRTLQMSLIFSIGSSVDKTFGITYGLQTRTILIE